MTEPVWISVTLARAVHQRQLAEHGGSDGVRDAGLLDSALAKPKNRLAYSENPSDMAALVPVLAAAYAYGVALNHPFIDGNKRTAAVVCETFLELNGFTLETTDEEMYKVFMQLAEGRLPKKVLAEWIRDRLVRS